MKLDQRSQDFSWRERSGPFRVISQAQAQQWNKAGYFILKGALHEDVIGLLRSEIDPLESARELWLREQHDGRMFINRADDITFTAHLVKVSKIARQFVRLPVFADLCIDLVASDARLYWDQAVYKKPGTPLEFPWHQDNGYTFVVPQDYLTCWVPLTSATVENGCPWVVPGIHRSGTLEHWQTELGFECLSRVDDKVDETAIAVEAEVGDIVVFSSLTPHRTGPNLTDDVRKSYIVQFAADGAMMFPRGLDKALAQADPERNFLVCSDGKPVPQE
ncbi:MAG: phytanoyl-CoA dioxygenase family protein [Gammaproteobacteria bacterium]|jgi:phytanoyl-CoA hydroxylase|nr:phytanoyl-CoA dioxygenase family protein [Gammaproteobacteria bacterium]MBT5205377.1 phytanoyl-CoA dioxygenase family protein [Gammaproteobacteria bacterium]MBT5603453.1 phytanoyl-CoA dioxygenase family protein [Gammaproteobacteria bacterium]MBT6245163.1 phytanoyl-CoA dioxygenase family protein [Gammaproteobacteria bacterium]